MILLICIRRQCASQRFRAMLVGARTLEALEYQECLVWAGKYCPSDVCGAIKYTVQ